MKLRGFKIVHQNRQSLGSKIDQLQFLLHDMQYGIQLLTLSETWVKPEIPDREHEIPGYMLFRKDREASCRGVAVYARNDLLVVTRREDLEMSDVGSFLVGTFYKPPHLSKVHDKNFIMKLDNIFDTVVWQEQGLIILGDWNTDFSATRPTADCKRLKHLFTTV